jgi:hypothetical protein
VNLLSLAVIVFALVIPWGVAAYYRMLYIEARERLNSLAPGGEKGVEYEKCGSKEDTHDGEPCARHKGHHSDCRSASHPYMRPAPDDEAHDPRCGLPPTKAQVAAFDKWWAWLIAPLKGKEFKPRTAAFLAWFDKHHHGHDASQAGHGAEEAKPREQGDEAFAERLQRAAKEVVRTYKNGPCNEHTTPKSPTSNVAIPTCEGWLIDMRHAVEGLRAVLGTTPPKT